ncbi:4Fe-4S binding protein, partial [Adlercreutzia sp. DFI.6.23]
MSFSECTKCRACVEACPTQASRCPSCPRRCRAHPPWSWRTRTR